MAKTEPELKKTEIYKLKDLQGFEKVKDTPCFIFVLPPNAQVSTIKEASELVEFLAPGLRGKKKGKYPFVVWSFGPNVATGIIEKSVENVVTEP